MKTFYFFIFYFFCINRQPFCIKPFFAFFLIFWLYEKSFDQKIGLLKCFLRVGHQQNKMHHFFSVAMKYIKIPFYRYLQWSVSLGIRLLSAYCQEESQRWHCWLLQHIYISALKQFWDKKYTLIYKLTPKQNLKKSAFALQTHAADVFKCKYIHCKQQ